MPTSKPAKQRSATVLQVVVRAVKSFVADDALTLCAALSFYTLLSFAPLLVLAVWATGSLAPSGVARRSVKR